EGKRYDISQICQDIQGDNDKAADEKRSRQISLWVFDFTGRKGYVVPGRLREQRAGHCTSENQPECQRSRAHRRRLYGLQIPVIGDRVPPVRGKGGSARV